MIGLDSTKVNSFYLKKEFRVTLGFTNGEGNFNIKITDLKDNSFKNVQFTFQIALYKDKINVLEYKDNLKYGHISKSKDRLNYFVNDINSLLYIIIPIFYFVNLNSLKYHHFILFTKSGIFEKKNKNHLSDKGKSDIIGYKKDMQNMTGKWIPSSINNKINITKYWLSVFIDA